MTTTFDKVFKEFDVFMKGREAAMNAIGFPGDIYVFGVWSGASIKSNLDYLKSRQIPYDKVFGFDSFEGLPREWAGIPYLRLFKKGEYSSEKLYGVEKARTIEIIEKGINNSKLRLIPGWFKDTLTADLVEKEAMGVASFVEIDVDLYGSTMEVLRFLFSNKLMKSGTVIYFDDWGAMGQNEGGEALAWNKVIRWLGLKVREIFSCGRGVCVVKVFKIEDLT